MTTFQPLLCSDVVLEQTFQEIAHPNFCFPTTFLSRKLFCFPLYTLITKGLFKKGHHALIEPKCLVSLFSWHFFATVNNVDNFLDFVSLPFFSLVEYSGNFFGRSTVKFASCFVWSNFFSNMIWLLDQKKTQGFVAFLIFKFVGHGHWRSWSC